MPHIQPARSVCPNPRCGVISIRIAIDDLTLDKLYVVYPGEQRFMLADGIEAVPLWALLPAR